MDQPLAYDGGVPCTKVQDVVTQSKAKIQTMIQAKRALERAFPDRVVQVARPFCTNRPQTFVCLVGVVCPTDSGRQRRQGRRIFPATARTSSEHTETTRSGVRGASGTRAEPTGLFVRWSRPASCTTRVGEGTLRRSIPWWPQEAESVDRQ